MVRLYELCVDSHLANLAEIADFVAQHAVRVGLNEDDVFAVQMAVDEACTNSMQHAYEGREDGEVRVCCYLEDRDFVVRISDQGHAFDPATVPEPDISAPLETREIGGLGLFFMRKLMDSVEFHFDASQGNEVIMRKRCKGECDG
jgi:anti-sigma regulatory factor (Ser/Thr protein kinase)